MFCRLKDFCRIAIRRIAIRRIVIRYDRRAANFLADSSIAATISYLILIVSPAAA
jgi:hypothetical protein